MKSQKSSWLDPIIVLLVMTNALVLFHQLHLANSIEQSAQMLAVLLFYAWLAKWIKHKA
jgi:hypothetical protein